jgi:sulfur carrier protein
MIIWVNQTRQEVDKAINLHQLMQRLQKVHKKGIAVALHHRVIPRTRWQNTTLQEEDKITIITATQGG